MKRRKAGKNLHDLDHLLCDCLWDTVRSYFPENFTADTWVCLQQMYRATRGSATPKGMSATEAECARRRLFERIGGAPAVQGTTPSRRRQKTADQPEVIGRRVPRRIPPWNLYLQLPAREAFAGSVGAALRPQIRDYLLATDPKDVLLADHDIQALADCTGGRGYQLNREWRAYRSLRRVHRTCYVEIAHHLGVEEAKSFMNLSVRISRRLEKDGLGLDAGIRLIAQWLKHVRGLLISLGRGDLVPPPEGNHPTPDTPGGFAALPPPVRDAVERIRARMHDDPVLRQKPTHEVYAKVRGHRQTVLTALGYLADTGEYRGHRRRRRAATKRD